jgi:hypothetical protein
VIHQIDSRPDWQLAALDIVVTVVQTNRMDQ